MRSSEVTIPQLLKKAGYATCMSGKWHCNGKFNSAEQPQPSDAGFDHWFGTQNNAIPSHENPKNFVRNGKNVGVLKGFSCQLVVEGFDEQASKKMLVEIFAETGIPVVSASGIAGRNIVDVRGGASTGHLGHAGSRTQRKKGSAISC